VLVVLNLSGEHVNFEIKDSLSSGWYNDVFENVKNDFSKNKNFEMVPWGYLVYEKR
jgi:hypothetical protein